MADWSVDRQWIWAALYAALILLALLKRTSPATVAGVTAYAIAFAASHAWQVWPNPWADPDSLEATANRLGWWYDVHGFAQHAYLVFYAACLFWFRLDWTARLVWGTAIVSEIFALLFEDLRCNLLHHPPLWTKIAGWGDRDPDTCVALFGSWAVVLPAALYWGFLFVVLLSRPWRTSATSPPTGS